MKRLIPFVFVLSIAAGVVVLARFPQVVTELWRDDTELVRRNVVAMIGTTTNDDNKLITFSVEHAVDKRILEEFEPKDNSLASKLHAFVQNLTEAKNIELILHTKVSLGINLDKIRLDMIGVSDETVDIPLPEIEIMAGELDHERTDFVDFDLPPFDGPGEVARTLNDIYAEHKEEMGQEVLSNETNRKSAAAKAKASLRQLLQPRLPENYEIRFIGL